MTVSTQWSSIGNKIKLAAMAGACVISVGCAEMPIKMPNLTAGTTTKSTTGERLCASGSLRASIAVSSFTNKSGGGWGYNRSIGRGMADQLTTALVSSGCFKVVERQNLEGVMAEQGLGQSGAVDSRTAARAGRIAGADLIITAAVTEFMENASGTKASGGGALGAVVGGILGGNKAAHMAIDLRITDVQSSEVIAAQSVEGSANDINWGAILGSQIGGGRLKGALSGWENTPRGKAMRAVIKHSVSAVREMIPQGYYRHAGAGRFSGSTHTASYSSSHNSVGAKAQKTLKALGFYNGAIDGSIGPKSKAAIRAFQEAYELDVSGALDAATIKKLNELSN